MGTSSPLRSAFGDTINFRDSNVALLERFKYGSRALSNSPFLKNIGDVVLNGAFGHFEGFGDFAIAMAAGHHSQHLNLAHGEWISRFQTLKLIWRVLDVLYNMLCDRRSD